MPLHRLTTVSYLGGLPSTHDFLNDPFLNGDIGVPANADTGKKSLGPNEGTYFIAFGEDGTSEDGNRSHQALGESTDFLDDVVSGELPVPTNVDAVAGAPVSSVALVGDVFVGKSGTANTQDERDRLISVVDSSSQNEIIDSSGLKVTASLIHDGLSANVVGTESSGFFTAPTINFTPPIPSGTTYRVIFAKRGSLVSIVPNKVDLDALTRLAIRSAHEVPAETLRFILEAGRRVGGSVAALAATIFETPGLGENILGKANDMFMDVDPDATVGTGGTWSVRFDRDGTPKAMMRVNEGTGGDSTWENVFERIAFLDTNHTLSGFTPPSVALSEVNVGARSIDILSTDPGSQTVSIMRRLNARQAVTCGVTRGDFIGATAIADAIDFAIAAGITDLLIELTEEAHTVANKTVALNLTIEGVGGGATLNTDGGGIVGLAISAGFEFNARNIRFRNPGGTARVGFTAAASASVLCENCTFENRVELNESQGTRAFAAIFRDCDFIGQFEVTGDHAIIELTTAGDADTYLFENCTFTTAQRLAVLRLTPGSPGSPSVVRNIRFVRCTMDLVSASVTGGDPDYNTGLIFMEATGSGNLEYQDITFEDCNVLANSLSSVNQHAVLLDFRCGKVVRNFNILGGRWEINPIDSVVSPFFLGHTSAFPTTSNLKNVRIENVEWGFTGSVSTTYGDAATALGFSGTVAEWAAFVIQADDTLTMKDVRWLTCTVESDSGDLFIFEPRQWNIDGVEIRTFVDTSSSNTPDYRVKFRSTVGGTDGSIENLTVDSGTSLAGAVVGNGIVEVIPNNKLLAKHWTIANFINVGAHGIFVPESIATEIASGLRLESSRIATLGGDGFRYIDTASATSALGNTQFHGCDFFGCEIAIHIGVSGGTNGISIGIRIHDCRVTACISEGVVLEPQSVNAQGGLSIVGNNINTNNGGISNVQMRLGSSANQIGDTFLGVMYGNDFGGLVGVEGQVEFNVAGSNDPVSLWGSNTGLGISGTPPAGGYPHSEKVWTTGAQFLHNRGRYLET